MELFCRGEIFDSFLTFISSIKLGNRKEDSYEIKEKPEDCGSDYCDRYCSYGSYFRGSGHDEVGGICCEEVLWDCARGN